MSDSNKSSHSFTLIKEAASYSQILYILLIGLTVSFQKTAIFEEIQSTLSLLIWKIHFNIILTHLQLQNVLYRLSCTIINVVFVFAIHATCSAHLMLKVKALRVPGG